MAIAFIGDSRVSRQRSAPARPPLSVRRMITTPGSSTVGVCFRSRLLLDYDFATHRVSFNGAMWGLGKVTFPPGVHEQSFTIYTYKTSGPNKKLTLALSDPEG